MESREAVRKPSGFLELRSSHWTFFRLSSVNWKTRSLAWEDHKGLGSKFYDLHSTTSTVKWETQVNTHLWAFGAWGKKGELFRSSMYSCLTIMTVLHFFISLHWSQELFLHSLYSKPRIKLALKIYRIILNMERSSLKNMVSRTFWSILSLMLTWKNNLFKQTKNICKLHKCTANITANVCYRTTMSCVARVTFFKKRFTYFERERWRREG